MATMSAAWSRLTALPGRLLDLVLPPRCLTCGAVVARQGALCAPCWSHVTFLGPPCCARCGRPFEIDGGPDAWCAACLARPPAFDRARAVFAYDDWSRDLVLAFKHGDRTQGAATFGQWLYRAGAEMAAAADLVAPVPLHRWRLLRRRYNQSALLAQALSRVADIPVIPDLVLRTRATPSQGGRNPTERRRNVRDAFAVHGRHAKRVAGSRVLLVDDVLTTGATVNECTRTLLKAGATAVDVLTLARVVQPAGFR